MNRDEVWRAIDNERSSLADLLDDLTPQEWETPSLCDGWRVRDVAAHLTLAQIRLPTALLEAVRARGNYDRLVHDTAVRQARLPVDRYGDLLRGMVGSRRKAPFVTHLEPLLDILVHGQDIAVPLGRTRAMPTEAAAAAVDRIWPRLWTFRPGRQFAGLRLSATDHPWSGGDGPLVEGPIAAVLLLITGRRAALSQMAGPGLAELATRFPPAASVPG